MAYYHGVKASEVATSILSPAQTTAGLPVVIGTAPVHMASAEDSAGVNKPVLCYSFAEAKAAFGYSDDWHTFTMCEAMFAEYQLYAVSPVVFINVFDPTVHKTAVAAAAKNVTDHVVTLTDPVILSSLVVKATSAGEAAVEDTDYVAAYDTDGNVVITLIQGGALYNLNQIYCAYDKADVSKVDDDDIIGGVDNEGNETGLELIGKIRSITGMVPGLLLAPGWSEHPEVAAVMRAKASSIEGIFKCTSLTDINTAQVTKYSGCYQWKQGNAYTGVDEVVCWPMVKMGEKIYHMSTHIMGIIGVMDDANGDVPYQSPSNLSMQITGCCLADGTEVNLSHDQADLLNSQGIMTALNFSGGWKSWGNYTGCYPGNTDVKDSFICVRRWFNWWRQTFILTYWQKVDQPLNKRLIKTLIDSEQVRLNGYVSRGFLLAGEILFLEDENPVTDLLNGIIRVHTFMTPPVPAQQIEDIMEYDVNGLNALFE